MKGRARAHKPVLMFYGAYRFFFPRSYYSVYLNESPCKMRDALLWKAPKFLTTFTVSDDYIDEFYNQFKDTQDKAPKRDIVMLMRDFNTKVGAGYHHREEKVAEYIIPATSKTTLHMAKS